MAASLQFQTIQRTLQQLDDKELERVGEAVADVQHQRGELKAAELCQEISRVVGDILEGSIMSEWRPVRVYDTYASIQLYGPEGLSLSFTNDGFFIESNPVGDLPIHRPGGSIEFHVADPDAAVLQFDAAHRAVFKVNPETPDFGAFPMYCTLGRLLWTAMQPYVPDP